MSAHAPWSEDRARSIIASYQALRGALLPMLHGLQEEFGYIDEAAVPILAETLNLSKAEVHGVISFYHDFKTTRPGHHTIKICRAEACQAMGVDALIDHATKHLRVDMGGTTPDGVFTLEAVYCLGNCALSPALMINEELHGRVDPARFDALVDESWRAAR